jgi:hypothetical protein
MINRIGVKSLEIGFVYRFDLILESAEHVLRKILFAAD